MPTLLLGILIALVVAIFVVIVVLQVLWRPSADAIVEDDLVPEEESAFIARTDITYASRSIFDPEVEKAIENVSLELQSGQALNLGAMALTRGGLRSTILGDVVVTADGARSIAGGEGNLTSLLKPGADHLSLPMPVTDLPAPGIEIPWGEVLDANVVDKTNVSVTFRLNDAVTTLYRRKLAGAINVGDVPAAALSSAQSLLFSFDEARYAFLTAKLINRLARQALA
jgi:hypothetical protein